MTALARTACLGFAALALSASVPTALDAHFRLLAPGSWVVESDRGDPQKLAPCGNAADAKPTGTVDKAVGGSKLHIKVQETVYHPGHYRVALAVNSRAGWPAPDPTPEKSAPTEWIGGTRAGVSTLSGRSCRWSRSSN